MTIVRTLLFAVAVLPVFGQFQFPPEGIIITNGASGYAAMTSDNGLAAGSLFRVNLNGLYLTDSLSAGNFLSLRVRTASGERDLTILSSQEYEGRTYWINTLLPDDTPLGEADIVVVTSTGKSFSRHVWIVPSALGLLDQTQNYSPGGPVLNQLTTPILPGGFLTLWGTGLGRVAASDVTIEVAGVPTSATFAGRAPGQPGVDQINFRFPEGVPEDCYLALVVRIAGRASNPITVSKSERPGSCKHPLGLSAEDLQTLDNGGKVAISDFGINSGVVEKPSFGINSGVVENSSSDSRYIRYDSVNFLLVNRDAGGVALLSGERGMDEPLSGCSISTGTAAGANPGSLDSRDFADPPPPQPVVQFPNGQQWQLEESVPGHFFRSAPVSEDGFPIDAVPPSIFQSGDWILRLPGFGSVPTREAVLPVPPPFRLTNRSELQVVSRGKDLAVRWDRQSYSERERVNVVLLGATSSPGGFVSLDCHAPASAGSLTVPSATLSEFLDEAPAAQGVRILVSLSQPLRQRTIYSIGSVRGALNISYFDIVSAQIE